MKFLVNPISVLGQIYVKKVVISSSVLTSTTKGSLGLSPNSWRWRRKKSNILFVQPLSHVQLFCNPMDCKLPGSSVHGISQYQSGLPFPSPGDLPNAGIEPMSPALQVDSLPLSYQGRPSNIDIQVNRYSSETSCLVYYQSLYLKPSWKRLCLNKFQNTYKAVIYKLITFFFGKCTFHFLLPHSKCLRSGYFKNS